METDNFDKLILKRQQWVQSSKENNFDFDSILAGIYNDPSHFIYEILQNAEDAGAKEISFNLFKYYLEIIHDGKDFDFKDVDGITGIGISTKKEDINAIGKFGVGFKSVFAITKTPIIHSSSYHFKIEDFVIPVIIENNGIEKTQILLPFNHPSRIKEEVFEIVSKKLENIGLKTLLFLKNVKEIKWQTSDKSGHYCKNSNEFRNFKNAQRVSIISEIEKDEKFEEYLVIHKPIKKIDSHTLKVEVAYRIGEEKDGNETIIEEKDSKLIVYFPTEKATYLNFLIQGPYKTTSNRENIPLDDEQNQIIIEETANLVADSIPIVKKLGYLNIDFLKVLPIYDKHCNEQIYSKIYDKVKEKFFSEEKLLPTIRGGFSNTFESLLASGKDLPKLLNQKDIKILFKKSHWLDKNITSNKTKELKEYLTKELGVKEIDFEYFAENITEEFLKQKSDKWVIQFYRKLLDQRPLWREGTSWRSSGVLRNKPIIRLENNKHISPIDSSGKIQVYIPTKTKSKYNTVKLSITKNINVLKFLEELGIKKPDIFAEIRKFILPKYINDKIEKIDDEYFNDIRKILVAFNEDSSEKKNDLISDLNDLFIIYSLNHVTGEKYLMKPCDVYLKNDELCEYFKGYEKAFFVNDKLYKKFKNEKLEEFLLQIGCNDVPKRIEIIPNLTLDEKRELRGNNGYSYHHDVYIKTKDFDYEGLDNYISIINLDRSVLLFKLLILSISKFNRWNKPEFFYGNYCWTPQSRLHYEKFDSKFLKTLKQKNWLFDKDWNQVNPKLISVFELAEEYPRDDDNIDFLVEALCFQPDEIKSIEQKTGKKVVLFSTEKYKIYLKWEADQSLQKEKEESNKEDEWTPEVEPENVETIVEEFELNIIKTQDYRGQEPQKSETKETPETTVSDDIIEPSDESSTINIQDIGKWGERYVFKHLNEKFENENGIEIKWLNQNSNVGKGYDFLIISNGIETEYIEVKSKIDEKPQLFEITGTQWEFARKLYNENEGNKYKIYIVSNAGKKNAKIRIIKNPTKLWKEGKLYAHPVYFKL